MNTRDITIEKLKLEIKKCISKLGVIPDYLVPKIDVPNDYAYPYVQVENNGTIYIVIREKGIEYERNICLDIDNTIYKLFEKVTFELALNEEKNNTAFSLERIKNRQKELLDIAIS